MGGVKVESQMQMCNRPIRVRRQQGEGDIVFWAGIIGNKLVGPWKVPEGVKITSVAYVNCFLEGASRTVVQI